MEKIFAILGLIIFTGTVYAFSKNKEKINWKSVGCAFIGQILLAFLLIKTPLWKLVELTSNGVSWIVAQANEGINFVFGGIMSEGFIFFINSLLPIVFLSGIMGVLFHFNILQKFISLVSKIVAKVLKVDTLVAVNGVANMFLGQTDSMLILKSYIPKASDSVIFAMMVGGMTSISCSVMGLYASYGASMEWIVVSMPLTVLSTLVVTQLLMPTEHIEGEVEFEDEKGCNFLETMMNYANAGFKCVIGITVALLVFLSLVGLINNFIGLFFDGVTIQSILGFIFYPLSVLMGVPKAELMEVSQLLATKLITNEAVAFGLPQFAELSVNAKAMITVALCGFSGIGSIGILAGSMAGIAPEKVKIVARLGVKALLSATIVNMMSATVVALFL